MPSQVPWDIYPLLGPSQQDKKLPTQAEAAAHCVANKLKSDKDWKGNRSPPPPLPRPTSAISQPREADIKRCSRWIRFIGTPRATLTC
ncbi:hypothetical protein WJX79_006141 [Trebouxia sp. C0005]